MNYKPFEFLLRVTFYNHYTAGFISAVYISGHTTIFARVFWFAVENFQCDHTVRVGNCVIAFR